jgi:hypothetical protein
VKTNDLWKRALDDAGLDESAVRRVVLAGGPEVRGSRYAIHFPPGATGRPAMTDLSDSEAAEIDRDTSGHRVAHVAEVEHEPGLLGLLRAQLEHVRQWDAEQGSYKLTFEINGSLDRLYAGKLGGAVVYHALPLIRDGTAAGGRLIRAVYGPQFGRFHDTHFGPLYRTEREPGSLDTLAQRSVVFGAIHAEELDRWATGYGLNLNAVLSKANPEAPQWWEALLADDLFGHLRKSAPAFDPSVEEIERHGGSPAVAWRPLEALLDRAHEQGLWLLNRDGSC